jgi:hypothetical protein
LNSLSIFKQEPYLIEAKAEEVVEEVWVEEEEKVEEEEPI